MFFKILENYPVEDFNFSEKRLFRSFQEIDEQLVIPQKKRQQLIHQVFTDKMIQKWVKRTRSRLAFRRLIAAHRLSELSESSDWLIAMIEREKNLNVIFYLIYFSMPYMNQAIFNQIMTKVSGSSGLILDRYATLIANHYDVFEKYLMSINSSMSYQDIYVFVKCAYKNNYLDLTLQQKTFLFKLLESNDTSEELIDLLKIYLAYLETINDPLLLNHKVFDHSALSIRVYGFRALAKQKKWMLIDKLFDYVSDDVKENHEIVQAILPVLDDASILNKLFYYQVKLKEPRKKMVLADILSEKIDYIILKMNSHESDMAAKNIRLMVEYGYTSGLIAFINQNRDLQLEHDLIKLLEDINAFEDKADNEFLIYLSPKVLGRYDLKAKTPPVSIKEKQPVELSKIIWLIIMLMIALLFYPVLSLIQQAKTIADISFAELLENFVLDTNRNLIYYFMAANGFYFILLTISLRGAYKQDELWMIKSLDLLYENDLLPAISIIAPAYNEEVNIITSVKSLLNLKYPQYEVIVVNDGSKDNTLDVLIRYFKLKRSNPRLIQSLKTKPVRGLYKNREYPNLVVVNKVNGGKADALNVGINAAKYPYICGIDADSVLDQDAILRLMSASLDHKDRPVALGGNIVPANGCVIDHGFVEEKYFPKEILTRFQGIEYIRAFTSGRIGWSDLKSLLIISGAFGLFYKKDIIDIGGYITSSGNLKKDSVGEDMELVVRLTYERMKKGKKQYIGYIYHANCYTELPSDLKTLLKQRNRWHRGLIDILSYHRHIFLNPKYRQIGLVATPYFYIFEVLGPFFEWIGYLMLVLSFILGFLSGPIVLAIFGLSILMGMVISLFSLYIQESQSVYTSKKDVFVLVMFAILENFGYRQMLSAHRIYSFFTAMFEKGKWGEQKRKGI
jgi:cellulose synthase/poly-beta-1,6-N-acetylglucosamine synthase-like glycosyltransferase